MKTERKPKGENKMIKNKRKHLSALYEHLDAYVRKKRNLPITENQAKKITEDSLGPFYNLLDDYILKKGNEIHPVIGIIFSNRGADGRKPLFDATKNRTKEIMAYWYDEKNGIIEITAKESGYEIRSPESMNYFFYNRPYENFLISYLDVSHIDVSDVSDFSCCFRDFGYIVPGDVGKGVKSEIIGLETWDVVNGEDFSFMFSDAFNKNDTVELNLSTWRFNSQNPIKFIGTFESLGWKANKVNLDVTGWNVTKGYDFSRLFEGFAPHAKTVKLKGVEDWPVGHGYNFNRMFKNFAPHSNYRLNLSNWNKTGKLVGSHKEFSDGTFFKIREPIWKKY